MFALSARLAALIHGANPNRKVTDSSGSFEAPHTRRDSAFSYASPGFSLTSNRPFFSHSTPSTWTEELSAVQCSEYEHDQICNGWSCLPTFLTLVLTENSWPLLTIVGTGLISTLRNESSP